MILLIIEKKIKNWILRQFGMEFGMDNHFQYSITKITDKLLRLSES